VIDWVSRPASASPAGRPCFPAHRRWQEATADLALRVPLEHWGHGHPDMFPLAQAHQALGRTGARKRRTAEAAGANGPALTWRRRPHIPGAQEALRSFRNAPTRASTERKPLGTEPLRRQGAGWKRALLTDGAGFPEPRDPEPGLLETGWHAIGRGFAWAVRPSVRRSTGNVPSNPRQA
jgi:hypothetical protein